MSHDFFIFARNTDNEKKRQSALIFVEKQFILSTPLDQILQSHNLTVLNENEDWQGVSLSTSSSLASSPLSCTATFRHDCIGKSFQNDRTVKVVQHDKCHFNKRYATILLRDVTCSCRWRFGGTKTLANLCCFRWILQRFQKWQIEARV